MSVKVSSEVTVTDQTDATGLVQWYQLSSSATKPAKPTTTSASATPSGWTKAEPTFDPAQGTKYLYTSLQLVWGDGTCSWGDVQLSSSYEQAKQAWNKANAAQGGVTELTDAMGSLGAPYTEVEWVESNGTQFVYLDWKPPINTWGFEADFIIRNAFNTTQAKWNEEENVNNAGFLFGTRNATGVNDIELGSYSANGFLRIGNATAVATGMKTDKTRQTIKLIGTTLTKPNGTTATVTRVNETADKPYCNMAVFAYHEGLRRGGTGYLLYPSTSRVYSLKFYEGTTVKVHLVGAIRNCDGMTGLYDKVADHFYPAANMTHGDAVGPLGEAEPLVRAVAKGQIVTYVDNRAITRMWHATIPELDKLEDGQKITVIFSSGVSGSKPADAGLVGWDETATSSYSNVFLKLTLADGSETEWVPCYYSNGTRLTTHYASGTPVLLTYRENVFYNATTASAGTAVMRGWWADPNYVDGNTTYTKYSDTVIAGKNGLKVYTLCMKDDEDNWTTIVNQSSTGASDKTCYTGGLKLGNVLYHATNGNYAAGANGGQMWETYGGIDFRRDANGITDKQATTELQLRKPIYFVGTIHDDGLFYLDTTKWWTQDPNDGSKVYVLVGTAYSSYYAIFLAAANPTYVVRDGELVEITDSRFVEVNAELVRHADSIELKADAENVYTKEAANALLEVKANKATLTSEINASADTVKIDASRVNITGEAVFGAINNDTSTTKINGGKIDATSISLGESQVTGLTTDLANAAKTATNYIQADSDGIKIRMSSSSNTYQHQTADATTFYVGGKKRSQVGATGLQVFIGDTAGQETSVASFGSTARIGTATGARVVTTSTGIEVYNSSNQKKLSIGSDQYIYGGSGTYPYLKASSTSLQLHQSSGNAVSIDGNGMTIWKDGTNTAGFGDTSFVRSGDSSSMLELDGSGVTIMTDTGESIAIHSSTDGDNSEYTSMDSSLPLFINSCGTTYEDSIALWEGSAQLGSQIYSGTKYAQVEARGSDGFVSISASHGVEFFSDKGVVVNTPGGKIFDLGRPTIDGRYKNASASSVSTASGTAKQICKISVDAGIWLIAGWVSFASNATGRRVMSINNTSASISTGDASVTQQAVSGAFTGMHLTRLINVTSDTAYYLNTNQNSGSSLNVSGNMYAIRLV